MIEVGVVIDRFSNPVYWHAPDESTAGSLPDSRALWDFLWDNRTRVFGFAHTHPGGGIPEPSMTDLTTFSAIERGLGFRLTWWIVNSEAITWVRWYESNLLGAEERARVPLGPLGYVSDRSTLFSDRDPWVIELRRRSGIAASQRAGGAR